MAIRKFKAQIWYTADEQHPDRQFMPNYSPTHEYHFEDTYKIDTDMFYCKEELEDYIKHDLKMVAGGGYNTDHIHNCRFLISLS